MASVYSEEVAVGSYNRIRLRVDYSGTSASCHIEFRRTSAWEATWGDDAAQITLNGQTKNAPYWYTGYVDGNWREIDSASGYTIPAAGGTVSWTFNNPMQESVLGCSGTITLPAQGSAPSGGYVTGLTSVWDPVNQEVVVSVQSLGVNDGGLTLDSLNWNITEVPYVAGVARISRAFTNGGSSSLSNSLNEYTGTTITLQPNTTYYVGIYAHNAAGEYRYNGGTFTTASIPPAKTYVPVDGEYVSGITAEIRSGGAGNVLAFDADVWYAANESLLNKTREIVSINVQTSSSGNHSFTIVYEDGMVKRPFTTDGISFASTATSGTDYIDASWAMSLKPFRREASKIYVPVESQTVYYTGTPRTRYVSFDASVFNANSDIKAIQGTITYLTTGYDVEYGDWLSACIDGVVTPIFTYSRTASEFGISFNSGSEDRTNYYIDLTATTQTQTVRKGVSKVYVPVYDATTQTYKRRLAFDGSSS